MKTKKALMAALVFGLAVAVAVPALAATYLCVVNQVGIASTGVVLVNLTAVNGAFSNSWKTVPATATYKNQLLATALTAISSNLRVNAETQVAAFTEVKNLYVTTQ